MALHRDTLTDRIAAFDASARIALVTGLLVIGAVTAAQLGWFAALVAVGALGAAALFTVRPPARVNAAAAPEARAPIGPSPVAALIGALKDPIVVVDGDRVTEANAAAKALLGAHILGQDIRLALRDPVAAERLAKPTEDGAIELAGLGGRDMHWEMHVGVVGERRRVIHLVDRSIRRAAERARVDFVANASHELRTPLSAILGFVETLGDDRAGGDRDTRARFLGVIRTEARRMQALIEDLMSLSRIEADKHQRPTTKVDLGTVARQAVDELRDAEGKRPANVTLSLDTTAVVLGDRGQLLQVIHNLVENALKYGRAGAPVNVTLATAGKDKVALRVVDQGEGIASEHIPRLTERFYRVDAGRSRAGGGTGLGLAIVKHIVERHRGRLEITSTLGVGSTVSVTFPTVAEPAS